MSFYLDTSVLVKAITPEHDHEVVQTWIAAQLVGTLFISGWSITEVHSALALKRRTKQIDALESTLALSAFAMLRDESFVTLSVSEAQFSEAANLIDRAENLRAGDALHLALARHHQLALVTFDKTLLMAAAGFGTEAIYPTA